jgi:phosphoribosylanthranilate isomerase
MNAKLKICGMRYPINILEVGELRPDFMGFIFYDQSPRYVSPEFRIPSALDESIQKVGVFVDDSIEQVLSTVKKHNLDYVQLHGDETGAFCEGLKAEGTRVIKVFSVDHNFDFKTVDPYKAVVDFFLFDTKGLYRGGNASAFDWNLLQRYDQEVPFFLSGGISISNVDHALQLKDLNLYGLDVNSGVELNPGVKDVDRIAELIKVLNQPVGTAGS